MPTVPPLYLLYPLIPTVPPLYLLYPPNTYCTPLIPTVPPLYLLYPPHTYCTTPIPTVPPLYLLYPPYAYCTPLIPTVPPLCLLYHLQILLFPHSDRNNFGARYGHILPSFCQISHSFDQREILLSHNILKYLNQKMNWLIVQLKMTILSDFKS